MSISIMGFLIYFLNKRHPVALVLTIFDKLVLRHFFILDIDWRGSIALPNL